MRAIQAHLRYFDWLLACITCALICVGLLFVYSAGAQRFATRQAIWLVVGAIGFLAALYPRYTTLVKWGYLFYGVVAVLLLCVLAFGPTINGAKRWLVLGPFRLQPSEFMKLAFILAISKNIVERRDAHKRWLGLWQPLALAALPMACIVRQPDLGMALIFLPVLIVVLFVAGTRKSQLATIVLLLVVAGVCAWPLLRDYQKNRLKAFINPQADPAHTGYQIIQSLIAVGSGGITGAGWRQGMQNMLGRVPYRHTDFIFPVIAEEWGLVGASFTLLLYYLLVACGYSVAARTREPYGRLVVVGVITLFAVQIVVNIGMTMGLAPVTGLALPFASYGGSSLLSSLIGLGLVANVGMRRERVLAAESFQ